MAEEQKLTDEQIKEAASTLFESAFQQGAVVDEVSLAACIYGYEKGKAKGHEDSGKLSEKQLHELEVYKNLCYDLLKLTVVKFHNSGLFGNRYSFEAFCTEMRRVQSMEGSGLEVELNMLLAELNEHMRTNFNLPRSTRQDLTANRRHLPTMQELYGEDM